MAYTLDTAHPLYANLVELIGVEDGALVSLVTSRTFTVDASASFGTGTYGEHLTTTSGGTFTPQGASMSPTVDVPGGDITIFIAVNALGTPDGFQTFLGGNTAGVIHGVSDAPFRLRAHDDSRGSPTSTGTTTLSPPLSCALARTQQTSHELFLDGVSELTGGALGSFATATMTYDYIGGDPGQGVVPADYVWIAWFDRVLTTAEVLDLHNSLGADNEFGLIESSTPDTTAPALSSPTAVQTGPTTADLSVETDEGNGTLYWVVTTSATGPSVAQIQAGQDHTGTAAADSGSTVVSATGVQADLTPSGLTAGTTYYAHFQHTDAASNDSTVVTSASFTTAAVRVGFNLPSSGVIYDGNADDIAVDDAACTLLGWSQATLPGVGDGAPDYIVDGLALTSGTIEVDLSGEGSPPTVGDVISGFVHWVRADSSVPAFRFINASVVDLDA